MPDLQAKGKGGPVHAWTLWAFVQYQWLPGAGFAFVNQCWRSNLRQSAGFAGGLGLACKRIVSELALGLRQTFG